MTDWFVLNVRDGEWWDYGPARLRRRELVDDEDRQVGVNVFVLGPGEPMAMYHWEADQEGFLVLAGEALPRSIDGEERHDQRSGIYVHCPPRRARTRAIGAGSGPCAILAIGAREHADGEGLGRLSVLRARDEAQRLGGGGDDRSARSRTRASRSAGRASSARSWLP